MNLLRQFPILTFALVLLSIVALCVAQESMQLLLWAGTLAAMSWYFTEGPRVRSMPRWVSNLLVIAASLWVFVDLFQNSGDVMRVLGRFAVVLTLIKLYERRTARDHAHLLTLSLLLMVTTCLQTRALWFGIVLLVYAALGVYVLLLYQLYASFEHARQVRQAAIPKDYRLVPPLKPVVGRHVALQFRGQATALALLGALLSVAVFVVFPREVGTNMLGFIRAPGPNRATQFNWEIDLHTGGRISESRARAFTVQFQDANGRVMRQDQPLLLRGAVLDRYLGGGRWRSSHRASWIVEAARGVWTQLTRSDQRSDSDIVQRVTLLRSSSGAIPLFSIYAPIAVQTESSTELLYEPRKQTLRTHEDSRSIRRYSVRSSPDAETSFAPNRSPRMNDDWFAAEDQKKLRDTARSILLSSGVPVGPPEDAGDIATWHRQAAAALTRYLQSEGGFSYTTDLRDIVYNSRHDDPIVQFLLKHRRGHCEFFASGLAALCHSIGIPVRVVAGYIAYQYDEATQEYIVLEMNAHAWVEVRVGERQWASFDPTPPGSIIFANQPADTFASAMRELYSTFDGNWSQTVVAFDGAAQSKLADSFNQNWSARIAAALGAVREWMERVNQFFNVGPGGYIWMAIVASALLIAVIALMKIMKRSRAIKRTLQLQYVRGAEYQRMLRHLGFYLDMLNILKRAGRPKPEWQPPLQYSEAVAPHDPIVSELVRRLTDMFYAARYGHRQLGPKQLEEAQLLVQDLATTLKVRA